MSRPKLNNEKYIDRCKKSHCERYDYSKTEYVDWKTDVVVTCKEHGDFTIRAIDHYFRGCQKCGWEKLAQSKRKIKPIKIKKVKKLKIECNNHKGTFYYEFCPKCKRHDQYIEDVRIVHNNEYDYSLAEYINTISKIKIICKKHGEFEQIAGHHKRGSRCPDCVGLRKRNNKTFIEKANEIHDYRYDYSLVNYKNNVTNVLIICKEHGPFDQIPKHHLKGSGCPECKNSHGENAVKKFLEENNFNYKRQKTFIGCKDVKELQFDFYLINHNICIEYDGIQHFKVVERFGGIEGFKKRIFLDNIKTQYCIDNNIQLIRIRYDENILDKLSFLKYL